MTLDCASENLAVQYLATIQALAVSKKIFWGKILFMMIKHCEMLFRRKTLGEFCTRGGVEIEKNPFIGGMICEEHESERLTFCKHLVIIAFMLSFVHSSVEVVALNIASIYLMIQ